MWHLGFLAALCLLLHFPLNIVDITVRTVHIACNASKQHLPCSSPISCCAETLHSWSCSVVMLMQPWHTLVKSDLCCACHEPQMFSEGGKKACPLCTSSISLVLLSSTEFIDPWLENKVNSSNASLHGWQASNCSSWLYPPVMDLWIFMFSSNTIILHVSAQFTYLSYWAWGMCNVSVQ